MRRPTDALALATVGGLLLAGLGACQAGPEAAAPPPPDCDPDDAGLTLPDGFCALLVAEVDGNPRHLAVSPNGDVFAALRGSRGSGGGVLALRDTTGDGRVDVEARFDDRGGTGIGFHAGHLYFAHDGGVVRWAWEDGRLEPAGPPETVVEGLPGPGTGHAAKNVTVDAQGHMYVNIGGPSNACQEESRTPLSPGMDPCPELENRGGIWRFEAERTGQTQSDGVRFATGLRNTFALDLHPETGELYGVQHGRDALDTLWPDLFTTEKRIETPSEELVKIEEGDDFRWPYCYHDPELDRKVLAPEYGGDGEEVGRCAEAKGPVIAFPAHWAPNDLLFYTGAQFPARYRHGAFVAFHGSWNRAPAPQEGYNVVFAAFRDGEATGEWEVFADGFRPEPRPPAEGADGEAASGEGPDGQEPPTYRPTGLAQGPDGSLYVADDRGGRIYRIVHRP